MLANESDEEFEHFFSPIKVVLGLDKDTYLFSHVTILVVFFFGFLLSSQEAKAAERALLLHLLLLLLLDLLLAFAFIGYFRYALVLGFLLCCSLLCQEKKNNNLSIQIPHSCRHTCENNIVI